MASDSLSQSDLQTDTIFIKASDSISLYIVSINEKQITILIIRVKIHATMVDCNFMFFFQSQDSGSESLSSYHTCESSRNSNNTHSTKSTDNSSNNDGFSIGESAILSDSTHDQSTSPLCRGHSLKRIPRYHKYLHSFIS